MTAPTLTITPPRVGRRERILTYGAPSAGKSYAWQSVLAATPDHVQFHVVDTDANWETAMDDPRFAAHAHRVHVYEPLDILEYRHATQESARAMSPDDWFILDLADKAWSEAQDFYHERSYAGDPNSDEFVLQMLDGRGDEDAQAMWGKINQLYRPIAAHLIRCPGNVMVAATAKEMTKDKKGNWFRQSRQDVKTFGSIGMKPGGQKGLGHDLNTVFFMSQNARGRSMKVVKDRNREHLWGDRGELVHNDFPMDYLVGIAGWVPEVAG